MVFVDEGIAVKYVCGLKVDRNCEALDCSDKL